MYVCMYVYVSEKNPKALMGKGTHSSMFSAALFTVVEIEKQSVRRRQMKG